MKKIAFSEQAKADIRAIPQAIAMNILTCVHRLAETGAGRVKALKGSDDEKRLRVGDYRVRFTEEHSEESEENKNDEGTLRIHSVRNRKEAYR